MKNVLIFRHQLFKVSEPFITQQAEHLKQYRPIYIGRSHFGEAPMGSVSLSLEDFPNQHRLYQRLWQVVTRDSRPYFKLLIDYKPNLIHAHFGVDGIYALPLARRLGIPLVVTFHGFDATISTNALIRSRSPSLINYALLRHQLAKHGDLFLCVSEYIRERVLQLGFPEQRTHVHYIGVDTKTIKLRDPKEETRTILHVARLVEVKGTEYLIQAFEIVAKHDSEVKLVIVGSGPFQQQLEALVEKLNIKPRVHFLGSQPHNVVIEWMRKATMLVLPSVQTESGAAEGLGMVLLEAAAIGLPLVGTLHGGIPEIINNGVNGYLVSERDVTTLADHIMILLTNRDLCNSMGVSARQMVEKRFDIRKQTSILENHYNKILICAKNSCF